MTLPNDVEWARRMCIWLDQAAAALAELRQPGRTDPEGKEAKRLERAAQVLLDRSRSELVPQAAAIFRALGRNGLLVARAVTEQARRQAAGRGEQFAREMARLIRASYPEIST
jgi:hypothetical protein